MISGFTENDSELLLHALNAARLLEQEFSVEERARMKELAAELDRQLKKEVLDDSPRPSSTG